MNGLRKRVRVPMVSVIMPIYNSAQWLHEAVKSICSQTYNNWELIAVTESDNKDNSVEILRMYAKKDARIIIAHNTHKKGIAGAINTGIDLAKGKYIARMDGDDISLPERLAEQIEFLDNNPGISIVGTNAKQVGTNRKRVGTSQNPADTHRNSILLNASCCL